jgi:hypothetical protein
VERVPVTRQPQNSCQDAVVCGAGPYRRFAVTQFPNCLPSPSQLVARPPRRQGPFFRGTAGGTGAAAGTRDATTSEFLPGGSDVRSRPVSAFDCEAIAELCVISSPVGGPAAAPAGGTVGVGTCRANLSASAKALSASSKLPAAAASWARSYSCSLVSIACSKSPGGARDSSTDDCARLSTAGCAPVVGSLMARSGFRSVGGLGGAGLPIRGPLAGSAGRLEMTVLSEWREGGPSACRSDTVVIPKDKIRTQKQSKARHPGGPRMRSSNRDFIS